MRIKRVTVASAGFVFPADAPVTRDDAAPFDIRSRDRPRSSMRRSSTSHDEGQRLRLPHMHRQPRFAFSCTSSPHR